MNEKTAELTIEQRARIVSGKSFWSTYDFRSAGVKSIVFSDGPSGVRMQNGKADSMGLNASEKSTCFPTHSAMSCSFDKTLVSGAAKRIGEEAAQFGVNVLLAPALNIKRSPLCGRNFEYFSEDPYLSGILGAAFVTGVQSVGVGACIKHFAANNKETGRTVSDSAVDARTLREVYLTAFEIAVKTSSPSAVMTAYNRLNGVFCNQNEWLLKTVLRGEWGHTGITVSDWGGTYDRVAAIKTGADLEMPLCKFSQQEILSAIEDGTLGEEELNVCADRIVNLSEKLHAVEKCVDCDFAEHADYARKCAEECAVLLKNDGVLPLKQGLEFALIGEAASAPVYQGGGSSRVRSTGVSALSECMRNLPDFAGYEKGYNLNGRKSKNLARRALRLAQSADVIIFVFGGADGDAEGCDRKDMFLPENQTELLQRLSALKKPVVAVLSCGGAVLTDWDEGVNALLYAGLNGQEGARAVEKILTGKVNPSGKLTETFPLAAGDVPSSKGFSDDDYCVVYSEGMGVGYRYFCGRQVKYPFGFGLSYTLFEYSSLKVGKEGACFCLKNVGNADGAEVAQMYITFPESAASPEIQLKGFEKVFLKAGEIKEVFIPFDEYSFRSFDADKNKWVTVKGEYLIKVGSSSADLPLCGALCVDGDADGVSPPDTQKLKCEPYILTKNKKGRIIADMHTPFCELKNSKAALVRLFASFALAYVSKNKTVSGTMRYVSVRTCAQYAKFDAARAEGLLNVFNGRYFKGIFRIIFGGKKKKRRGT